jgi:hypothetical protein
MDGACGLYGGEEKYIQGSSRKLKKRDHLQELSVDDSILFKGTSRNRMGGIGQH